PIEIRYSSHGVERNYVIYWLAGDLEVKEPREVVIDVEHPDDPEKVTKSVVIEYLTTKATLFSSGIEGEFDLSGRDHVEILRALARRNPGGDAKHVAVFRRIQARFGPP